MKEEITMMGDYGNGMGIGWLGMGVFWLLLLGIIVWLIVRLLPGSSGTTSSGVDSALVILDRRLASGEIDLEAWQAQRAAFLGVQDTRK